MIESDVEILRKVCSTCKDEKPLEEFDARPERSAKSRRTVCIICRREGQRRRYKKHCEENPFKVKLNKAKARAERFDLPFDLDAEYLESLWTGICPVYSIPIQMGERNSEYSAELDRKVPSLGYVKGNVAFISRKANRIKGEWLAEDLRKILDYLEEK